MESSQNSHFCFFFPIRYVYQDDASHIYNIWKKKKKTNTWAGLYLEQLIRVRDASNELKEIITWKEMLTLNDPMSLHKRHFTHVATSFGPLKFKSKLLVSLRNTWCNVMKVTLVGSKCQCICVRIEGMT